MLTPMEFEQISSPAGGGVVAAGEGIQTPPRSWIPFPRFARRG
jgi:hypothetical protein